MMKGPMVGHGEGQGALSLCDMGWEGRGGLKRGGEHEVYR